jgi:hypothetical protein
MKTCMREQDDSADECSRPEFQDQPPQEKEVPYIVTPQRPGIIDGVDLRWTC